MTYHLNVYNKHKMNGQSCKKKIIDGKYFSTVEVQHISSIM
jgi:hypothetical protein